MSNVRLAPSDLLVPFLRHTSTDERVVCLPPIARLKLTEQLTNLIMRCTHTASTLAVSVIDSTALRFVAAPIKFSSYKSWLAVINDAHLRR